MVHCILSSMKGVKFKYTMVCTMVYTYTMVYTMVYTMATYLNIGQERPSRKYHLKKQNVNTCKYVEVF